MAEVVVIHKPGKDPLDCASYHPISLLNFDLMLLTSILAARLAPYMQGLVDPDQSGFIPECSCSDRTRRVCHLLDKTQRTQRSAVLLSIDAKKAFDRVHWPYLEWVLCRFEAGDRFLRWVDCIYRDLQARIRVNGVTSRPFCIRKGTRQGCSLSPLLFVLYMEPFAERIRQNPALFGIRMGDREHKILLYADDVVLFLTQPLTSLSPLMEELESFSWASGFKVNIHKTQAHSSTLPKTEQQVLTAQFPFAWPSDGVPYLGMQIFPTLDKIAQVNYSTLLTEVRGELSNWRRHTMSWLGRLAAIKMTILPRILYVMQTLPLRPPPKMLAQLQRLIGTLFGEGRGREWPDT